MNLQDTQLDPRAHPKQDVYGVIGNPVAHSLSPQIHTQFARQAQQNIFYGKLFSEIDQFQETVNTFFSRGGKGLNVTVPFKDQAYKMCAHLTERAQAAGVVNILWQVNGQYYGDNSDGIGLVRDITHQPYALAEKNILILGAGGAVQGVILPFLEQHPKSIWIANRTLQKAQSIAQRFADAAVSAKVQLQAITMEQILQIQEPIHLIVNGTSAGLQGASPFASEHVHFFTQAAQTHPQMLAYDMVYGKETHFMQQMRHAKILTKDGLGMLVEQAAVAFEQWRQLEGLGKLNTAEVLADLRKA
jgi:shikimate dehydrogenase